MEEFFCSTRILSGPGAVSALERFGAKRLLLVADPFFVKNGQARQVAAAARAERVEIFDRVRPASGLEPAAEGTVRLRAFGPDLVAALGGGSTLDCAKAMTYFARTGCPLAAIPTTSGSGAEVTDSAVLTHRDGRHPLVDPRLRPTVAILDSDLLTELPRGLIAEGGFDLLTHAVEAYVSTGADSISDLFAREAFRSAYCALPASFAGRQEARQKVHLASSMAGIAFSQAGLGLCHAITYSLSALFRVPHGRLNAILLPAVMDCNAYAAGHRYAQLARAAGMGGSADGVALRNLKNGILRLRRELELPQTLAQAGISSGELWSCMPRILEMVKADPCCASNPIPAEDFLIRRVLEAVTGRA